MNAYKGYPCPCCGYLTMDGSEPGSFDICHVCNWEDDDVQFNNINFTGGANEESLKQARDNFKKFGASSLRYILVHVKRWIGLSSIV